MLSNCSSGVTSKVAVAAVETHDILCHLFELGGLTGKLSRKDLLRCALVSRVFCEPALRVLWRDMSPPTPLWRLLAPIGSAFRATPESLDRILSQKPYTDPILWARFMWYARFVQELHITVFSPEEKHKQIIQALVEHNGGKSIFPSLQTLWWTPSSYLDSSYFPLFTPKLRSAIFHFSHSSDADIQDPQSHTFLVQLQASSPRLNYLCVNASWKHLGVNQLAVISSFEHLTDLNLIAATSLTWFCNFATMPRMTSLRIAYIRSDEPTQSHPPAQIHAPKLTVIAVGGNCPSLAHLFTALDAPKLTSTSFHAMSDDRDRDADYISCIKALATVCPLSTMEELCIALDEDDGPQMRIYLTDLLNPLLDFPNLTYFSLSCPMLRLVTDDGDFGMIASAWPKLQTFKLWQANWDPRGGPLGSFPTPKVLRYFRTRCPDLQELVLPNLNFKAAVPAQRHVRDGSAPHGGLKTLAIRERNLGRDWVPGFTKRIDGKNDLWTRYILDLFPELDAEESL